MRADFCIVILALVVATTHGLCANAGPSMKCEPAGPGCMRVISGTGSAVLCNGTTGVRGPEGTTACETCERTAGPKGEVLTQHISEKSGIKYLARVIIPDTLKFICWDAPVLVAQIMFQILVLIGRIGLHIAIKLANLACEIVERAAVYLIGACISMYLMEWGIKRYAKYMKQPEAAIKQQVPQFAFTGGRGYTLGSAT